MAESYPPTLVLATISLLAPVKDARPSWRVSPWESPPLSPCPHPDLSVHNRCAALWWWPGGKEKGTAGSDSSVCELCRVSLGSQGSGIVPEPMFPTE